MLLQERGLAPTLPAPGVLPTLTDGGNLVSIGLVKLNHESELSFVVLVRKSEGCQAIC